MIGFFDSGLGGLSIVKEVALRLPEYDLIYLGDNARTPYGSRSAETIYQFTCEGVSELFNRGAELVILACNTSSAVALRRIQQEFLPERYPDKKVLGIIIPTAEEVAAGNNEKEIGILATEATIASGVYETEINNRNSLIIVHGQACPLLVPIIEVGETDWAGMDLAIKKYIDQLLNKSKNLYSVVLGCTHYALIQDKIRKQLPVKIELISQTKIIADKLIDYLKRHPEIETKLKKNSLRIFLTTENSDRINRLANMFFEREVDIKTIVLRSQL